VTSLVGLSALGALHFAHELTDAVGNFADFYGNVWWAGGQILDGTAAVPDGLTAWPPTATVFVAPLSLLPYWVALGAWWALSIGAFVGGLRLVGCRDRRALLVAVMSPPALDCLVLGNLSLLLAGGVAVAWAYRDRQIVSGIATGAVVAAKLWLWPLLVFFLLTRRWLSVAAAAAWTVGGVAVWLALSPSTLRAFPSWTDQSVETYGSWGIGLSSALLNMGASTAVASALALGVGVLVLAASVRLGDEVALLAGCVAAAILASPLVWEHYYVVLFVPIAVVAPRLGPLWLAPYLLGLKFLWPTTPGQVVVCGLAAVAATVIVVAAAIRRSAADGASRSGAQRDRRAQIHTSSAARHAPISTE